MLNIKKKLKETLLYIKKKRMSKIEKKQIDRNDNNFKSKNIVKKKVTNRNIKNVNIVDEENGIFYFNQEKDEKDEKKEDKIDLNLDKEIKEDVDQEIVEEIKEEVYNDINENNQIKNKLNFKQKLLKELRNLGKELDLIDNDNNLFKKNFDEINNYKPKKKGCGCGK